MIFPEILWEIFWCAFHSSLMYSVAMVTMKSKVTFTFLNSSINDHSKHSNVNFQTQNTYEKLQICPLQ